MNTLFSSILILVYVVVLLAFGGRLGRLENFILDLLGVEE